MYTKWRQGRDILNIIFGKYKLLLKIHHNATKASKSFLVTSKLVRVFSDVLVAFLYFDICHLFSGKYQNMEKPLKHQRRVGLQASKLHKTDKIQNIDQDTTSLLHRSLIVGTIYFKQAKARENQQWCLHVFQHVLST